VITLGRPGDGYAGFAVEFENLKHFPRLRPAKQLLEPRDIFEPLLEGFQALVGVGQIYLAVHPTALLLAIQELPQTFNAGATKGACEGGVGGSH
jgi:hypothetical protein